MKLQRNHHTQGHLCIYILIQSPYSSKAHLTFILIHHLTTILTPATELSSRMRRQMDVLEERRFKPWNIDNF